MSKKSDPKEAAVRAITEVFREHGYDGASLARLSAATGLGRSSLYHHFPNGKEDMARAALDYVAASVEENVVKPLRAKGDPAGRVKGAVAALRAFYVGGERSCLIDHFGVPAAQSAAPGAARAHVEALTDAFAAASRDAGLNARLARARAEQAVVELEGALVVARALESGAPFDAAMRRLPNLLLEA